MKKKRLSPLLELGAVAALLVVPLPIPVGPLVPLVLLASIALWARGQSWAEVGLGGARLGAMFLTGIIIGVAAPLLELAVASPLLQGLTARAPEASPYGMVRGSPAFLATMLVIVTATAAAVEMVFRGYVLARVESLTTTAVAVAISAAGSAWLGADGDPGRLAGGFLLGLGFAGLYLAGKRSLVLPMVAHALYDATHLVLVYAGVLD